MSTIYTARGARAMDRVAAEEAATRLHRAQIEVETARQLAQLQLDEAASQAAERAQERAAARAREMAWRRQAAHDARTRARAERRARWRSWWAQRRALAAVLPMMGASAGVALPAQASYYGAATHSTVSGVVIAVMVEGGTWMGAALEAAAVAADQPVGRYRLLTWGLAATAAGVNLAHGWSTGGLQVGVVFALASLLGPTAWSAYARLRSGEAGGLTRAEVARIAWRRIWHPITSWRAGDLQATATTVMTAEQAWAEVWPGPRRARRSAAAEAPVGEVPAVEAVEDSTGRAGVRVEVVEDLDRLDPAAATVRVEAAPEALGDGARGGADVWALVAGLADPVLPEAGHVVVPVESVEARPVLAPVWVEAPVPEAVEADELVVVAGDPETEQLLEELEEAIETGELAADASVEAVRRHLGIRWQTARALRVERAARARALQAVA